MKHKFLQIILSTLMLLGLVLAPFGTGGVSASPDRLGDQLPPEPKSLEEAIEAEKSGGDIDKVSEPSTWVRPVSTEEALAKIHPDLQEIAKSASPAFSAGEAVGDALYIQVGALPGMDLSAYFVDGRVYARPAFGKGAEQTQFYIGYTQPHSLMKLASLADVQVIIPIVLERNGYPDDYPIDDEVAAPEKGPEDWAALQATAEKRRAEFQVWDKGLAASELALEDWFEVAPEGPHKAQAAWDRGYRGEGVTVAVLDDGIDSAHPDLIGTQRIYSSTVNTQYNGWPMVFSPFSQLLYATDEILGTTYIQDGFPSLHYVDTSQAPAIYPCGTGVSCFDFATNIVDGVPGTSHTYFIASSMTQSGVVHAGTHPDNDLRDNVWGEKPAVLVTDPNVAGVYDTVIVDLDDDYDFRDEAPLTRADTTSAATLAATYNNMVLGMDLNGDGLADISGGMLYFIADGVSVLPASDYVWGASCPGLMCPDNGELVAFTSGSLDGGYSHGTQCASNVVAQGVIQNASLGQDNDFLPTFRDLGPDKPTAAVFGMAPDAKMVDVSNIYWNYPASTYDAYLFAAVGYDGIDQTDWDLINGAPALDTDAIQINSNSYGSSSTDNDGWEYAGQLVSQVQRWYGPYLQFMFSTGNGAPGYGTAAPPSPETAIAVGASTEYGSTGWDTITDTNQIMFNDVAAFSNSGPGAREGTGADVLAGGAFAAGDLKLNSGSIFGTFDGNLAWDSWGGTSRSAPVAMGVLALLYDAYKDTYGVWPTFDVAKALLMSSSSDLNINVLRQGAGSVNADAGTAAASGDGGTFLSASSSDWQPGDFRGDDWPGFAHVVSPGDTWDKEFTVVNETAAPVTVDVSDATFELINEVEIDLTVTAAMNAAENADNFYKAFHYMIPITATASADASMQNIVVPPGTEMMVVRQMFPFDEFDYNGDYNWDNRFYLMVYNWKDVDGDGIVWDDKDSNSVVNFVNDTAVTLIDGGTELLWDDPITELDRWEYGRFGYNRPTGNTGELIVHDPLDRMHDGLFIGLRHHPGSTYAGDTHLSYRIEFYQKADVPWLTTSETSLLVPAGDVASFTGEINVPNDILPGDYEAAIEVLDPSGNNMVIPVVMNVAADFDGANTLGGVDQYLADYGHPYNNAAIRGYQDWGWRAESGDWRFFYMDIDNEPVATSVWTENFNGTFPPTGWTVVDNEATGVVWNTGTFWGEGNYTGGSGEAATVSSDAFGTAEFDTELRTPAFDLPAGVTGASMSYLANYQNFANEDFLDLDISTDSGSTWTTLLSWNEDHGGFFAPPGELVEVDLSAYLGMSGLILRWRYYDPALSDWEWYAQIDDVEVVTLDYPIDPATQVMVRDQWDAPAPHTDIDTIVLGPTATSLGSGWFDFPEPDFYGPYTLDTVAASPNTNVGAGTWLFNTSSGANEDWVAFEIGAGGLHRLLEHNVMFEGAQFDVVFTKTVGMLFEDPHSYDIDTYQDAGIVGDLVLESTIDLNGLVVDAYVGLEETTEFVNEPIPFVSSNTIEWTYPFTVTNGVTIDINTSSPDIADIDLYLFYCGVDGNSCEQRASSTTGSADEHVAVTGPEDGIWLAGINNWSGPAGHFNMTIDVASSAPGIYVSGVPTGPIAANTPVPLEVTYDFPMDPGTTYYGVVVLGPPEAPSLKEVPVAITRHGQTALIDKSVDLATAFPGDELVYTVDLFNITDPDAFFEFEDPIPAGTDFVDVNAPFVYDSLNESVVYSGTLPISGVQVTPFWVEDFEDGVVPPAGWTLIQSNPNETWGVSDLAPYEGTYNANIVYDPALVDQDEWLVSTPVTVTDEILSVWSMGSVYWCRDTFDNCDLEVWVVVGSDVDDGDDVLLGIADGDWIASYTWSESQFDLDTYTIPDEPVRLGFRYTGNDGAEVGIDYIRLLGIGPAPAMTAEITVEVNGTVSPGDWVTNTATLDATHLLPQEDQFENVSANAYTHIGLSENGSYKEGPTYAEPGEVIMYDIHVVNYGDAFASVSFTDTVPANTSFTGIVNNPPSGFEYDAVDDEVSWAGSIGPKDELVFTFYVRADYGLPLRTEIVNDAVLTWNGETSSLSASTEIIFGDFIYLPYTGVE